MNIGRLHLVLLHFPIALILAAAVADVLWLIWRRPLFREGGFWCAILAGLAGIPTVALGFVLMSSMNLHGAQADLGEMHEHFGLASGIVAAVAGGVRLGFRNSLPGVWPWIYGVLIAAAAVLVSLAGYYGGELAWGQGFLFR